MYIAGTEEHHKIYESYFVRDLRHGNFSSLFPTIIFPNDYHNEPVIRFAPSQHEDQITEYEQRKLTKEWIDILNNNRLPLIEVQTVTSITQRIFDGLCLQNSIESLRIKLLNCKDLSKISNLSNLKKLFIECGSKIEDITPLTELKDLEILILGETNKITDYSCLKVLKNLKVFSVCAYQTKLVSSVKMRSTDFIREMTNLEYLDIVDVKISE